MEQKLQKTVAIRLMTLDDYDGLFALWKGAGGMGLRSLDDSREGIARFLERNPRTSFVALSDGRLVGATLCGHDGRRGYIYHTIVALEYRRQGIGSRLVEAATDALRNEGITRVCLHVMETNAEGKEFWRNRDWERKDFLELYSKPITDAENRPLFSIGDFTENKK